MPERIETTYADLRPSDLVIDKAGNAWPIAGLDETTGFVHFWLLDPGTKVKKHHITKPLNDPVPVSRIPTQSDEAAKLEAEVTDAQTLAAVEASDNFVTLEEAVAAVEDIGGAVEAEVTAAEVDAANAATEDAPVTLPPFESMTPLERRSHLYLLHGTYCTDVQSMDTLSTWHQQLHSPTNEIKSKVIPHVHAALMGAKNNG